MLAQQRQEQILDLVNREGAVRVTELTGRFDVSDMTIRRDLDLLAGAGLVQKVHGGATRVSHASEIPLENGQPPEGRSAEREAIARRAAELVKPGATVGISGGATGLALAQRLTRVPELVVVTNCLTVAATLSVQSSQAASVIVTGGVRTPSDSLVGPLAIEALGSLHVDLLFLQTQGFDAEHGLTSPNLLEAETHRAMIESARRVVLMAESSTWKVVALSSFARLDEVDVLVTDAGLSGADLEAVKDLVDEVHVVRSVSGDLAD